MPGVTIYKGKVVAVASPVPTMGDLKKLGIPLPKMSKKSIIADRCKCPGKLREIVEEYFKKLGLAQLKGIPDVWMGPDDSDIQGREFHHGDVLILKLDQDYLNALRNFLGVPDNESSSDWMQLYDSVIRELKRRNGRQIFGQFGHACGENCYVWVIPSGWKYQE